MCTTVLRSEVSISATEINGLDETAARITHGERTFVHLCLALKPRGLEVWASFATPVVVPVVVIDTQQPCCFRCNMTSSESYDVGGMIFDPNAGASSSILCCLGGSAAPATDGFQDAVLSTDGPNLVLTVDKRATKLPFDTVENVEMLSNPPCLHVAGEVNY